MNKVLNIPGNPKHPSLVWMVGEASETIKYNVLNSINKIKRKYLLKNKEGKK